MLSIFLRFAYSALFMAVLSVALHELGHALTAMMLGGEATVTYDIWLRGGVTHFIGVNQDLKWIVYGAGGWLTAIVIWAAFGILAATTKTREDLYLEMSAFTVSLIHLIYGYVEASRFQLDLSAWWLLPALPWAMGIYHYANVIRWLKRYEGDQME